MESPPDADSGRLVAIWRYPVKSMLGEQLNAALVAELGVVGDRTFALIDQESGKVVSAKNPRRWPNMFEFRAALVESDANSSAEPCVEVTFPDGDIVGSDAPDIETRLSAAVGRPVRLARSAVGGATSEGYWPDHEWLSHRDETFDFALPPGTFFDDSAIHLITTATLERLEASEPNSDFDVRRFRPNFLIQTPPGSAGFVEDQWIGRTLTLGSAELLVERHCPRCVMTTLAQGVLPKDPAVLRTAVQRNAGNVGVYARVIRGGRVEKGDTVRVR